MPYADEELLPSVDPVQYLDAAGRLTELGKREVPDDEVMQAGYAALVAARRLNDQAYALVRQGRLAVYPSSHGQEACQVAAAMALDDGDWLFPTYRDTAAVVARGVDPVEVFTLLKGDWHCGYDPRAHRVAPQTTPLATQLLHAVGVAHAARLRGEPTVAMALCGDGATSEGDFHEALNFAAVFHVPVVFFVQNNEYAISVPLARQTAAPSLAHKGIGYGVPGERVDGNDLAALLSVLRRAVAQARSGQGPQLIEAHTYRMQAHTNADDATRYRQDDEVAGWVERDPLRRVQTYLQDHRLLDESLAAEIAGDAEDLATRIREGLNADVQPDHRDLFDHVYARRTPQLAEQESVVADELARTVEVAR
ncbi:pyruvate dehydrogenase E1 component alpha subunit [Branchiibius hedensis]|uniref:Pyruvate dehydrogenase E1 component alpha subunit n=1 Tax=Branchiibius hedensis TaxID=672460 RepID=A0A2Y8ZU65_9MICO|nr:pyruvate dehydrogenase (acetyl-transferring) E1 component subunit alpha [Branchiibius hedensis]PWJ25014.1 pyruvate dehydrogenase E1 component alpha subunit [Branchiibius hedensis]SSA33829.1 pyruvate dehydrogenase E1 component alpha subunit [Branchiibius hedensis]